MNKIKVHTCLIGKTGYNNHVRDFLKPFNKLIPVKVRNFTVGSSWEGLNDEPHNGEKYMDYDFKTMLKEQSLWISKDKLEDYQIYKNYPNDGNFPVNLVLMETYHHYFYEKHEGYNIAYNVWETTRYPDDFFETLLRYDQLWVASKWQREMIIEQGYPEDKIFVVPEAVDGKKYKPIETKSNDGIFRFMIFGRWEYRKSTTEMIQAFVELFGNRNDVELVISVENPYPVDGMHSTEERLKFYGFDKYDNIKVLNFPENSEYINYLQNGDVFLSCARAEGWNLPLIEAMACGTPSIYSNWSGQLEFAEGRGIPVNMVGRLPATVGEGKIYTQSPIAGDYGEPDYEDLKVKMKMVYDNYSFYKERALKESEEIREIFTWENAAKIAKNLIVSKLPNVFLEKEKIEEKYFYNDFAYVTCGNEQYMPIIEKLVKSLNEFSERKIIVYGVDCDVPFDYPNLIKRKLNYDKHSEHDKWFWKQYSNIDSINENFENFVWVDGDVIVNHNIDDISNYFGYIENYPISDVHTQEEHYGPMINDDGSEKTQVMNEHMCNFFGIDINKRMKPISHVCFYIYNKECKEFFNEVIETYKKIPLDRYRSICLWNDEGVHNFVLAKNNYNKVLPLSNLDVSNYDNHTMSYTPNSLSNFATYWGVNGEHNFNKIYAYEYIPENKKRTLYFHGNKNTSMAEEMISIVKHFKNDTFRDSGYFYTKKYEIKNLGKIYDELGGTLEIANKYGWDYAIYHEIYNLKDYKHKDIVDVDKGDVVVDLGGNIGVTNRWFHTKGASKVISFEPDKRYFDILKLNCGKNSLLFNVAISNKIGEIELVETPHLGGSYIGENKNDGVNTYTVQTYTLDYLFDNNIIEKIDYLKIDIEGAEHLAIEGISDNNLLKVKKVAMEYHHGHFNHDENLRINFMNRFHNLGFNSYLLYLGTDNNLQMIYFWK